MASSKKEDRISRFRRLYNEYDPEGNYWFQDFKSEEENQTNFTVTDNQGQNFDSFDDDADKIFDRVCAICDDGGCIILCKGPCMRSFHPTLEAGADASCKSLGFSNEDIATFLCDNCKHQKHQCFACGKLGSSDKSSSPEVFPCLHATCRHFYHPECAANLIYPSYEPFASQLKGQIAAGITFTCPMHKCHRCGQREDKDVHELQFAVCRRCPKSYHRRCLPKTIAFKASDDGTIVQRAWDGLLPKRILLYCRKHEMIPNIGTPKRDHILFPSIVQKRDDGLGNFKVVTDGETTLDKGKSSTVHKMTTSFEENIKLPKEDMHQEQQFTSKPVEKMEVASPPEVDAEMEARILQLMKDVKSSMNVEELTREFKRRFTSTIYRPQYGLDEDITMKMVEDSVEAINAAIKEYDDGGSVDDAMAVCEPILQQLAIWKRKLGVYLSPFTIGGCYTPFERHFTTVDKLKEIVDRLHWYVKDGDTIEDFSCGSNDFSCLMRDKLVSMGKKCRFKNYDIQIPKDTFYFEKKDWFNVSKCKLPNGSRLVIGLNPPFGVGGSLADKFVNHALKFKPKLLILILPKEAKRLNQTRFEGSDTSKYDLIWSDDYMLSGKSFYIPESVDEEDKQLEDWNKIPPSLTLELL